MEVTRSKDGILVSQKKYILDLNETGMIGCKFANTPMESTTKLGVGNESVQVDKKKYQRLVGKLIYLPHTKLDICFQ